MTNQRIAWRVLKAEDGSNVTVSLDAPEDVAGREWQCAVTFEIDGVTSVKTSHGEDAFQALILAIELIRVELKKLGKGLSWLPGTQGDTGFPRSVPSYFGPEFSERIDGMIEAESIEFGKKARQLTAP